MPGSGARRAAGRLAARALVRAMRAMPVAWRPRVAGLLPGTSARFGPPRRWLRHDRYVARHGGEWRVVVSRHTPERPDPRVLGARPLAFARPFRAAMPDAGVLFVEGVRLGAQSWLVGKDDCLLPDNSWFWGTRFPNAVGRCPVWRSTWPPRPQRIPGRCLSLVSDWADTNYFHFVVEGLGRFALAEAAGIGFDDVDAVYVPALRTPVTRWLLERLGVPAAKVVTTDEHPVIECEALVAPSFPGYADCPPPWLIDDLRRRLGPSAGPPARRLYVSRGAGRRRILNEDALVAALGRRGFEVLEPGGSPEDLVRFAEARTVVGGHGAGLTNTLFCRAGTPLLELMPPQYPFPAVYTLAHGAGLRYACVVGRPPSDRGPRGEPRLADYLVDVDEVERALDAIEA